MTRKSKTEIVEAERAYSNEDILTITINEAFIDNMFTDTSTLNATLCKLGLLTNTMTLSEC
ncbi:hypothetical protein AAJ76_5800025721 [Vairimorpha ceranae]|uniref:Uncharacterized protein n=1 Tax=Vairimorpha ceranae TaxID=40302 RepID=A0A0F9WNL6_9MICR|nr:hypothetical protein AAJ76_5800025721 [Vairimorpha ceranae]KKO74593.1 hypothetical protein AAJ76_5800025721 [Vairimorpha ceranae]